jgi:hypothetical protein
MPSRPSTRAGRWWPSSSVWPLITMPTVQKLTVINSSGAWGHEACWNLVGRFKVAVGDERGNAFGSPVAWRRRSNADCIRERHDRGKRVNTAGAPAAADVYRVGISARKIMKVINDPHLAAALVNAQFRIRSRASVPLSTRLSGKIRISGSGRLVLGNGITLIGNVVPIELISYEGACISIGDTPSSTTVHRFLHTDWSRLGVTAFWDITHTSSTTTSTTFISIACCRRPTRL